jgi:2-C-methyl-D-erythritol 4-phosphate cytidylyltransferase / 2-C-methyl-D-erythritol 2,4-cyclodiphosphate synthase
MTTAVVIVAAGSGQRLGSSHPKAFVSVGGQTLLEHSLERLNGWTRECHIIIVAPAGWVEPAQQLSVRSHHPVSVVVGGASRSDSVRAGLAILPRDVDTVLIHDAARAFMPLGVFDRVLGALEQGATGVVPELPVVDTLISIDRATGVTGNAVHRDSVGAVQTPQGFVTTALLAAYDAVSGDFTDDASVLRELGHDVIAVLGDADGFKITHPSDLERANRLLGGSSLPLVGTAIDVHQFDAEQTLWLAGLEWPGEPGLSGHSDGDVVIHAIVDALLQAAGLGDLGTHFGADRPEFAGARSSVFLEHALTALREAGYRVSSVGVQLISRAPKLGPRREEAQAHLSALVGAPVALSATTSDELGFTGRGEGAAALATAVLYAL